MAVKLVDDLKERLQNTLITGVNLINDDFRLKKILEQFKSLADKNPIFKKIYDETSKLFDDKQENKTSILLNTLALTQAVSIAQASFDEEAEIEEINFSCEEVNSNLRYSEVYPIVEAFNSKGSGRYEVIRSSIENNKDILKDYRVMQAFIIGLNDSYSELAELAYNTLLESKIDISNQLKEGFDPNGKGDMIRRLKLINSMAGEKENDFYLSLLDNSSQAIKIEAILCLGKYSQNMNKIMDLVKSEKGKVKKAVMASLGRFECEETDKYFESLILKNKEYEEYVRYNNSEYISDLIAEKLNTILDKIIESNPYRPIDLELQKEIDIHVPAMFNKTSEKMLKVIERFAENEEALKKAKDNLRPLISSLIAKTIAYTNDEKYNEAILNIQEKTNSYLTLEGAFEIKLIENSNDVYGYIEKYLNSDYGIETILKVIHAMLFVKGDTNKYILMYRLREYARDNDYETFIVERELSDKLDINLIKLLTGEIKINNSPIKEARYDSMLSDIINPNDEEGIVYFTNYFYKKCTDKMTGLDDLKALAKCKTDNWNGILVNLYKDYNTNKHNYNPWVIRTFILGLAEASEGLIKEIEALVADNEAVDRLDMMDTIKEKLAELKSK